MTQKRICAYIIQPTTHKKNNLYNRCANNGVSRYPSLVTRKLFSWQKISRIFTGLCQNWTNFPWISSLSTRIFYETFQIRLFSAISLLKSGRKLFKASYVSQKFFENPIRIPERQELFAGLLYITQKTCRVKLLWNHRHCLGNVSTLVTWRKHLKGQDRQLE